MYGRKSAIKPVFHIRQNIVQLISSICTAVLEFKLLKFDMDFTRKNIVDVNLQIFLLSSASSKRYACYIHARNVYIHLHIVGTSRIKTLTIFFYLYVSLVHSCTFSLLVSE
jgi:hypothetical protein